MSSTEVTRIGKYYTPRIVQAKFHSLRCTYPLMEGGRGGGKTIALLWEAIRQCLLVAGCNCLLLRRTLTSVEKGGIEDHFVKYVPKSIYKRHNKSKHFVTFKNGSMLYFGHIRTDSDLAQYQGPEFLFIGWEELTQFTYKQWDFMKGSNRCPIKTYELDGKTYKVHPRMAGGTNPNGKGSGWVKALWILKQPPAGMEILDYDPNEYQTVHSTYKDNPTYANDANYVRILNSISDPVLRAAWIPGSWEVLAGQYFQNWDGIFDSKTRRYVGRHIKALRDCEFEDWQERWIAIDWGFVHAAPALWFTRVNVPDLIDPKLPKRNIIVCYRQMITRGKNEERLAEMIADANQPDKTRPPDQISRIFLSPDAFSQDRSEHTIADVMGDIFVGRGLPRPERAVDDRVNGWRLMHTLLDTEGFAVIDTCSDVIESIPKLMRSEKDPEDAEKAGDDLFLDVDDACRYGLMSYAAQAGIPKQVQYDRRIQAIQDNTQKYLEYLRIQAQPQTSDLVLNVPRRQSWRDQ